MHYIIKQSQNNSYLNTYGKNIHFFDITLANPAKQYIKAILYVLF